MKLIPPRIETEELLDEGGAPRRDVERSLRDLRRINRYLGGTRTYNRLLRLFGPVRSVADVGAGTADLLDSIPGQVTRVAVDLKIEHLLYLRNGSSARRVVAEAKHLPFRDQSLDVVTSAHFFHHFGPDENVRILREALRVCRRGVAVNDTERHYVPLVFVHGLALLRLVGRITRFDAPASVRRGYTLPEAHGVAERVGAARAQVVAAFPYRFGIVLWK